jgi:hydrogenase nickel incorporation protein HypA/HybF
MHEMSIVEGLLDVIRQEAAAHPDSLVTVVKVRVGALRLVEPATLQFCFRAATLDTDLAATELMIESVPAAARCQSCRCEFPVEEAWFECPSCHATSADLLSGNELELAELELTQNSPVVLV